MIGTSPKSLITALCGSFVATSAAAGEPAYSANSAPKDNGAAPVLSRPDRAEQNVENLALADRVLDYARARRSPLAYLTAAQIFTETRIKRTSETDGASNAPEPDAFWHEARTAMASDEWARNALTRVHALEHKNLVNGPTAFLLTPGSQGARTLRYRGGEPAIVYVRPTEQPVRLTIFDQNGAVMCRTEWRRVGALCRWTPRWTGAFRVQLDGSSGKFATLTSN